MGVASQARISPEGFRAVLDEATLLQRLNRSGDLAALIQRALSAFSSADQQQILRGYLQ